MIAVYRSKSVDSSSIPQFPFHTSTIFASFLIFTYPEIFREPFEDALTHAFMIISSEQIKV